MSDFDFIEPTYTDLSIETEDVQMGPKSIVPETYGYIPDPKYSLSAIYISIYGKKVDGDDNNLARS
jgi:hypothetical protein